MSVFKILPVLLGVPKPFSIYCLNCFFFLIKNYFISSLLENCGLHAIIKDRIEEKNMVLYL